MLRPTRGRLFSADAVDAALAAVDAATDAATDAAAAANAAAALIADAGSDAEKHAQATTPFTDSNAAEFAKGAKGYAAEARAHREAAEAASGEVAAAVQAVANQVAVLTAVQSGDVRVVVTEAERAALTGADDKLIHVLEGERFYARGTGAGSDVLAYDRGAELAALAEVAGGAAAYDRSVYDRLASLEALALAGLYRDEAWAEPFDGSISSAPWVGIHTNYPTVTSGYATGGSGGDVYAAHRPTAADVYLTARVEADPADASAWALLARVADVDNYLRVQGGGSTVEVYERVGGGSLNLLTTFPLDTSSDTAVSLLVVGGVAYVYGPDPNGGGLPKLYWSGAFDASLTGTDAGLLMIDGGRMYQLNAYTPA